MTKNYFQIWILLCCFSSAIAQNYVPMKIVSGFNADVIANGVGPVSSSTTHTFDLTAFNLVSRDFMSQTGNSPLTFGLPLDGRIVANNDSNLIFQLNPYSQNNSLRLIGWGSAGDLVFETPENATRIDILTAAGNTTGSAATFSGEVRFIDNTIQSFNGLYAEDWYSYGVLSPTVTYGMGRVRASDNVLEKLNDFPRLFSAQINISVSNYYKKISSIHVFKTTSTSEVLHIMAITVKKTPDCFQPTTVQVNNITTDQATISWSAAIVSPNLGYEYEIRTSGLPGSGLSGLVASGAVVSNTLLKDITNLAPSTTYFVYVRSKCTATSFSDWSLSKKFETKCLSPTVTVSGNSICKPGVVNLTATTTDGFLQWYDSPTSQTVLQTGGNYTTPVLSATKSYWVDATSSNFISLESGKKALHTSANDVNTFSNWGISFDLTHDVYLKSTDVFVSAPGTLNVAIYDNSGTEVFSTGDLTLSALGILSPVTIPLNVQLKAGYGYKFLIKSFKDIKLYRDSSVSFPYKDVSETLSVSSGFFDGYTRDYYYYFYNLVFEKGCKSPRQEVIATVSNSLAPTTTLPIQTFCFEQATQLKDLSVNGSNIKWYNASTGGNQWSETALATDGTTYYASQTINGCESIDRTAIQVTIYNTIEPTASNQTFCITDNKTIADLTATGNAIKWYDAATGGSELAPSDVLTTKIYYASQTLNSCESANRTPVQVTIYNTIEPTASNQAFCIADNKTIADLTATGNAIKWYDAATGGSELATSDILTTKIYYASQTLNSCESTNRTPVQITIYNTTEPTASDQVFCITENKTIADLTATGNAIKWYDAATGGSELATSDILTTKIYYASQTLNSCESTNRTPVQITIYNTTEPTASDQVFCITENKTIADLTATGNAIKWYDVATGGSELATSDILTSKIYYASQTLNSCESTNRTPVQITIYNTTEPTASDQVFCITENKTIADLTATGNAIKWYDVATGGSELATSDILTSKIYYASQTLNNCESKSRTPVQVTIYNTIEPTASNQTFCITDNKTIADLTATGNAIKWYDAATGGSELAPSDVLTTKIYYASQTLNSCESANRTPVQVTIYNTIEPTASNQAFCIADNKTIADLTATGNAIKWYDAATGGSELATSDILTTKIYYASQTLNSCESTNRTPVQITIYNTTEPTASNQAFCIADNKTIADLTATGNAIKWYDAATGGSELATSDILTTKIYYASQTLNSCESTNRTPVQITIYNTTEPTASDQVFCITENKTIADLTATGNAIKWYDVATGGSELATSDILTSKIYYASQTLNSCESTNRTPVQITIYNTTEPTASDQVFCITENKTIADLTATGNAIKWYDVATGGSELATSDILTSKIYYASQTLNNCESKSRTPVQVTIYNTIEPTASNQAFCITENKTIADLTATGNAIKWYDIATGGNELATSDILTSKIYYASQTLNGCESANRTAIQVTIYNITIPTVANQEFCAIENKTIGDIETAGTVIKWYANTTTTNELPSNTKLNSGVYYAVAQSGSCYSNRIPVNITIKDTTVPTGEAIQYICIEKEHTIIDLQTDQEGILWYDSATGGLPLSSSVVLKHMQKYYASYARQDCESSNRLEVLVIIRNCDVVIHNGISANGDGKNDYFSIEGVNFFSDNKLEIFNRWGNLVYETKHYGQNDNLFKGFSNTGSSSKRGLLPEGTYYYIFHFTNLDKRLITKTGFLHLNY